LKIAFLLVSGKTEISGKDNAMSDDALPRTRLDMGLVVSQTFGIIGRNLVSIGAVAFAVAVLASAVVAGVTLATAREGVPSVGIASGISFLSFVIQGIAIGGITRIATSDLDGQRIGAGPALMAGLRLLLPVMGLSIVVGLGVGLMCLLLIIPGIWVGLRWLVSTPVLVAERTTIGGALTRSAELTKGNRWRLLGLGLAMMILRFAISFAIAFPLGVAGFAKGSLVMSLVELVASAITTAISATGVAACYVELRRSGEGASFRDLAAVFA
jgi:hypothetical protein